MPHLRYNKISYNPFSQLSHVNVILLTTNEISFQTPLKVSGFSTPVWWCRSGGTIRGEFNDLGNCPGRFIICEAWCCCDWTCHLLLNLKNSTRIELPHIATPNPANVASRIDRTACKATYSPQINASNTYKFVLDLFYLESVFCCRCSNHTSASHYQRKNGCYSDFYKKIRVEKV